ncbi:hypothetical protein IZ6_04000 [Terrihabitans soli]|uniref:Uncharacterized protein n=1 Tax=Terrihabitans soli TaxID=708113 RepID=A0A6S6QPF7_9HYPH|nr:hypothetical protein [Terrihabitans soli]BCJ89665.1 hypothetical protein IZ6_04000 [Terrihabitans soli]
MAQTAEIVSLSDYRQARAAARTQQDSVPGFEFPLAGPFMMVWAPVVFVPFMPQMPQTAQQDERP